MKNQLVRLTTFSLILFPIKLLGFISVFYLGMVPIFILGVLETFKNICAGQGTAAGIAALYGYESQIPEIAETKIEGLKKHYGMDSDDALNYFRVHIEADKEHASVEKKLLGSYLNESNLPKVKADVTIVLKALWDLLSAVCTRHQIH